MFAVKSYGRTVPAAHYVGLLPDPMILACKAKGRAYMRRLTILSCAGWIPHSRDPSVGLALSSRGR